MAQDSKLMGFRTVQTYLMHVLRMLHNSENKLHDSHILERCLVCAFHLFKM